MRLQEMKKKRGLQEMLGSAPEMPGPEPEMLGSEPEESDAEGKQKLPKVDQARSLCSDKTPLL